MYKGSSSRILPIIVILVVIVIAVAALISVGRSLFFSGSSTDTTPPVDTSKQALLDTSAGHSVQMTVRGPIVAKENFTSYQLTVTPNSRDLYLYDGYLEQVKNSVNLDNNTKAYEQFVYALDRTNFTTGTALKGSLDDTRGVCPTGYLYEFNVLDGQTVKKHLWSTTCSSKDGSLKANRSLLSGLFLKQIPDSRKTLNTYNF